MTPPDGRGGSIAGACLGVYLALIVGGYIAFDSAAAPAGRPSTRDLAFFHAVNAATLTGFRTSIELDQRILAPLTSLALTLAGGMLSLVVGGMAVSRLLRLGHGDGRIVLASAILLAAGTIVGASMVIDDQRGPLHALLAGATAVCNGGVVASALPDARSFAVQAFLLPLALLGGLGINVIIEIVDVITRRKTLSSHARVSLGGMALVYLAGTTLIFGLMLVQPTRYPPPPDRDALESARRSLLHAHTLSANSRTAGLPLHYVADSPRPVQWLLIPLMAIGACSAGTGGGLKVTALFAIIRGVRWSFAGRGSRLMGLAMAWLGIRAVSKVEVLKSELLDFEDAHGELPGYSAGPAPEAKHAARTPRSFRGRRRRF